MDWLFALVVILGILIILMVTGMPVALCFMVVSVGGMFYYYGGENGLRYLTVAMSESVTIFTLLPLLLFVLMGEIIFQAGVFPSMMDALDKLMGRIPGRLSLMAVGGGTLLSTLTGADFASVAMLGSSLVPEMAKRGYKKPMTIGPILGSGGLAIMIPPSSLAVFLGAVALISIGGILMGIIMPGLLMASLYIMYIVIRCKIQPELAPSYDVQSSSISEKMSAFIKHVLPIGFIVFMVIGVILLGVATPSQAAATGALSCFVLAAAYKKLNWDMIKRTLGGTISISGMILLILVGATAFSQILARSGASVGFVQFILSLPLHPILVLVGMQFVVLVMGALMEQGSIIMITIPLFMPVVNNLGFDQVWFAVLMLINLTMASISPPFGLSLFVMKGVAPPDTTLKDIYLAAIPFMALEIIAMALIIAFPEIALWLPGQIK